ncbi:hypothetical protein Ancab_016312 [Ancistrocladus abbreviatus]
MTKGKIVFVIKSEGNKPSKSDSVIVIESNKANMVVEAFYNSFFAKIIVKESSIVYIGSTIALIVTIFPATSTNITATTIVALESSEEGMKLEPTTTSTKTLVVDTATCMVVF